MECRIWWAARGPGGPTYSCMSTLSRKARSMAPVRLEVVSTSTFRSFLNASAWSMDAYSSTEQSADDHVVKDLPSWVRRALTALMESLDSDPEEKFLAHIHVQSYHANKCRTTCQYFHICTITSYGAFLHIWTTIGRSNIFFAIKINALLYCNSIIFLQCCMV
jgi:hypothetical protein